MVSEVENLAKIRGRLEKKQKLVILKERKLRVKRTLDFGDLILKAGLQELNTEVLFGALLEVKEMSSNEDVKAKWLKKRSSWENLNDQKRLIVILKSPPNDELKSVLKDRKFRWNSFRQEWYGMGHKEELERVLGKDHADITEVSC